MVGESFLAERSIPVPRPIQKKEADCEPEKRKQANQQIKQ